MGLPWEPTALLTRPSDETESVCFVQCQGFMNEPAWIHVGTKRPLDRHAEHLVLVGDDLRTASAAEDRTLEEKETILRNQGIGIFSVKHYKYIVFQQRLSLTKENCSPSEVEKLGRGCPGVLHLPS